MPGHLNVTLRTPSSTSGLITLKMSNRKDALRELPPEPVDERSPLLDSNGQPSENGGLEAQAEQERREYNEGAVPLADEPSTMKLLSTMGSLWVTTFFAALDTTIVATLSGPISSSFNSGTSFSWIASGYLIANAAFQPLSGKMTDIYGRRAGLIFASTFFAAGTLMCGLATESWVMIAGRVIGGAGGGCLNTVSVFVASDLIPLRKRGVWQGIGNIVFGLGMGLGGVFGGYINDHLSWRYAFLIQLPFIVVGGIWGVYMINVPVKETETAKIKRVDFLGAITLVSALVLFLLGLNSGGNIVPWYVHNTRDRHFADKNLQEPSAGLRVTAPELCNSAALHLHRRSCCNGTHHPRAPADAPVCCGCVSHDVLRNDEVSTSQAYHGMLD